MPKSAKPGTPPDEQDTLDRYARRKARTRAALKQAAAKLLVEKGYTALTVQDITDALDLARATFYIYYRDKDDILWALLEDSLTALAVRLAEDSTPHGTARHRAKLLHVFGYAAEQRALLAVVLGPQGHIGLVRRLVNAIAETIAADVASGASPVVASVPPAFAAQFLAGALVQVLSAWLDADGETPPSVLTDHFLAMEGVGTLAP